MLFLIVMDDVLTATVGVNEKNCIQWRPYKHLSHLDYTDNVCFLLNSSDGLKEMCEKLNNHRAPAFLKINVQKTKIVRNTRTNVLNKTNYTTRHKHRKNNPIYIFWQSNYIRRRGGDLCKKTG
jgi:hypothetical protein